MFKKIMFVVLFMSFILAACAPSPTPDAMMSKPTEAMMEKPTETMMEDATSTPDAMMDDKTATPDAMMHDATPEASTDSGMMDDKMMDAAWFGATLTNVRTGGNFTINDHKGKVVLVENMAIWCSTCKKQQGEVKALHSLLGDMGGDLVTIALDIDPNENGADLKTYADTNGFDWTYAVSPAEVSSEIGKLYGNNFLNPPSAPIMVIDRKGVVHPMPFGVKSADDLKKFIEPFLNESM